MNNTTYITPENKKELEAELENLRTGRRKEIKEQLEFAKSLGDLSENAEYHQAREDQGKNEDRIAELEHILQNAEVVSKKNHSKVDVGAKVTVKKEGEKNNREYLIVGAEEADIFEGKISYLSPLGLALVGKAEGDKIVVESPNGKINYSIISIK